jgi:hypothetical protein
MGWNGWIRQIHRWLSIIFTIVVVMIFAAQGIGEKIPYAVYLLPLLPLALLLLTGLYLFVLPYIAGSRRAKEQP